MATTLDTTSILTVYNNLYASIIDKYDYLIVQDKIDAETYAALVGQTSSSLMKLAIDAVQKQEVTDAEILTATKQQKLLDEQAVSEQLSQQALIAKTENEQGRVITEDSITESTSTNTLHNWAMSKAEQEAKGAAESVEGIAYDNYTKEAILRRDYNFKVLVEDSPVMTYWDETENTNPSSWPFTSNYLANLKKQDQETAVAENTAKGYQADSYYKVYRSLQELMFALANAGIVDKDDATSTTTTSYQRIMEGMEKAINGQTGVWGDSIDVDLNGDNIAAQ